MDPIKRNGYDSTVLTFDDSIPPSRSTLFGSDGIPTTNTNTITTTTNTLTTNYTDDDFYDLYGPVFTRNLRFDARLRPELSSNNSSNNSNSINGSKTKNNNNNNNHPTKSTTTIPTPPTLGDATTPLDQVHLFYDYWIHFTSWRDFSLQATTELELSDTIEQSESRYEKRYYQKEIDKRTKQLKRQEMIRIQTLVERAMEADPRLYVRVLMCVCVSYILCGIYIFFVIVHIVFPTGLYLFDSRTCWTHFLTHTNIHTL